MSVTNYTPSSERACTYNYSKLKDVVYLVSADHVKDVHVDNGYAYIDGLSELPLRINGFNIQFTESESLDERYRFEKKLTLSMHGYVNVNFFGERYYAIIETTDGTFYMINIDFPSRVTYTFNLGGNVNQTDFTFASLSNMPTLKIASSIGDSENICREYNVKGIESLELIECNHTVINNKTNTVDIYGANYNFRKVDFIGDSCTLQEVFDGEKVTDTIKFDIGFDSYKTSWHYNLLEFIENTYSVIILEKGDFAHQYNVGFGTCLQPSFEINSSTMQGESDKITITLNGSCERGLTKTSNYNRVHNTQVHWRYIKFFNDLKLYTCVNGVAQYLVKQEVDGLENPTGNYKVYSGYTSFYSNYFNVVGEFDDVVTFESNECSENDGCILTTDMPNTIYFTDVGCKSYSLSAGCEWSVLDLPEYVTITPSSGVANINYTISVCNTETPTDVLLEDTFKLRWGNNEIFENVKVGTDYGFIKPSVAYINCLAQSVTFTYDSNCQVTITSIDPSLSYNIGFGTLTVNVPFNSSDSAITWGVIVEDCNEDVQTVSIVQDKMYTRWATVSGYICSGDTSYTKEAMFSGTTSTNINTMTSLERMGTKIKDFDSRCAQEQSKFEFFNHYYCIDGDKYKALEEVISYDGGETWNYKSGVSRLGELVESGSSWCEIEPEYKWVLRDNKFQCGISTSYRWVNSGTTCVGYDKYNQAIKQYSTDGGTTWINTNPLETSATTLIEADSEDCGYVPPTPTGSTKFSAVYSNEQTYSLACNGNSTLTSGETQPSGYQYSAMTEAIVGDCVINIDNWIFYNHASLSSVTIGSGVTSIGNYAFDDCVSLSSVTIPNSVTSIGNYAFAWCTNLSSVTIGSGVTSIGDYAFAGCTSLTRLTVEAITPPTLGNDVFYYTPFTSHYGHIYVPANSVATYKSASGWSTVASRIEAIPT